MIDAPKLTDEPRKVRAHYAWWLRANAVQRRELAAFMSQRERTLEAIRCTS
jgi:hypothetical protein